MKQVLNKYVWREVSKNRKKIWCQKGAVGIKFYAAENKDLGAHCQSHAFGRLTHLVCRRWKLGKDWQGGPWNAQATGHVCWLSELSEGLWVFIITTKRRVISASCLLSFSLRASSPVDSLLPSDNVFPSSVFYINLQHLPTYPPSYPPKGDGFKKRTVVVAVGSHNKNTEIWIHECPRPPASLGQNKSILSPITQTLAGPTDSLCTIFIDHVYSVWVFILFCRFLHLL